MSQAKGKSKDKIKEGFVALKWSLLNSDAYKRLPASAAKALPYFLGKVKYAVSEDNANRFNQDFIFSYSEAKRLGFGKSTFRNILRDLVKHGLIDVSHHGHYKQSGPQPNTLFRLSRRWKNYDTPYFNQGDWERHFRDRPKQKKSSVLNLNPISPESEPFSGVEGALETE